MPKSPFQFFLLHTLVCIVRDLTVDNFWVVMKFLFCFLTVYFIQWVLMAFGVKDRFCMPNQQQVLGLELSCEGVVRTTDQETQICSFSQHLNFLICCYQIPPWLVIQLVILISSFQDLLKIHDRIGQNYQKTMKPLRQSPKPHKSVSLPKLQTRIIHNLQPHNYSRLNFPRKDDSNYVRDVGRKHFPVNPHYQDNGNVETFQKLINPEMPDYTSFKQSLKGNTEHTISPSKDNIKEVLKNKLYFGNYHTTTEISDPPYARNYQAQRNKHRILEVQRETNKERRKMKTQLNPFQPNFHKNYNSLNANPSSRPNSKRNDSSKLEKTNTQHNYGPIKKDNVKEIVFQDCFARKMGSVPVQLVYSNKEDHRKFNPTYISSNFM